jgi:predicted permease
MKLWSGFAALFRKGKLEADMAEEMRLHLEQRARENVAAGMSPDDAHYAALRKFGGVEQAKEIAREQRTWVWLEQTLQDLRYAAGSLRRNPVFSLTAVLTLVLGLGSTTTIFTLADAVLWRPLPWAEPDRLVVSSSSFTGQALRDWSEAQQVVEHIESYNRGTLILSGEGEAAVLLAEAVSPGMFDLLGRRPVLGRGFDAADAEEGNQFVVMLSDAFWRQRFGGDPAVVGRKLLLDDDAFSQQRFGSDPAVAGQKLTADYHVYTVIGVMPRGFTDVARVNVWIPLLRPTIQQSVRIIARLRPGVGFAAAQAAVTALNAQLDRSNPQWNKWSVQLRSMDEPWVYPGARQMLLLTLGAVTFVLLIACANVANLLLVRATARQREFAVRSALGAGGGRLIRQVLTESLVLVVLGATGGLWVAHWAVQAIWRLAPIQFTVLTISEVRVDWRVGVFMLGLVGLAAVVCGLVPALRASRFDANQSLNASTRTATGSRRQRRWQHGLVVAQTALAFVLLVGAGLLLRGFLRFSAVSPGFEIRNLAALTLTLPEKRYPSAAQRQEFFERLREHVAALPSVTETTLASNLPPPRGGSAPGAEVEIEGRMPQRLGERENLTTNSVAEDYFRVMRMPLLRGRNFGAPDAPGGPAAIIISDRMARRFWPDADPIGQRVRFDARRAWMTVVGIAGGVRLVSLNNEDSSLEYYRSMRQEGYAPNASVVVRTMADPERLGPAIRREVAVLDPMLPVGSYFTVEEAMARPLAISQFCLKLMLGFAGVALVLAAVGLYGVMSYTVAQRTPEIGVRIALGGGAGDIVTLVARRGLTLTGIGLAIGIAAALGLTRFLQTMLFEISPLDPTTFAGVAAILGIVGALACWLPARRAAKVDPVVALRAE